MEALRAQFVPVVAKFAVAWWLHQVAQQVEHDHKTTEALSDERLGQLKSDVRALSADAERHVAEFFSNGAVWWHLQKELKAKQIGDNSHSYDPRGRGGAAQT